MSAIQNVKNHYQNQKKLIMAIPEWGTEDEPMEMHIQPMSMAEVNMMQKIGGKKASHVEQAVNIIVVKARGKDGKRLFNATDREALMEQADYKVIARIAEEIDAHFFGNMDTLKGNSAATTSESPS